MTNQLHFNIFNICNVNNTLLFKKCIVSTCTNTTWTIPTKKFIPIPDHPFKRKIWLEAVGRLETTNTELHFCEDHFDLTKGVKCFCKIKVDNCVNCIRENFTPQLHINITQQNVYQSKGQNINQPKGQNKRKIIKKATKNVNETTENINEATKNYQDTIEQVNFDHNYTIPQPEFIAIKNEPCMFEKEMTNVTNIKQESKTVEKVNQIQNPLNVNTIGAVPKENNVPSYGLLSVPNSNTYYLVQIQPNTTVINIGNENVNQNKTEEKVISPPKRRKKRTSISLEETGIDIPALKRNKRTPFKKEEKELVLKVYKNICEKYPKETTSAVEQHRLTSAALGIKLASVYKILKEHKTTGLREPSTRRKRKFIVDSYDEFTKNYIRQKAHSFFFRNELPTLDKVLNEIKNDEELPVIKRTTLYRLLQSLNFVFVKRNNKSGIFDRSDIILWRRNYLRNIEKFREDKKIYYLDTTWINENHTDKNVKPSKVTAALLEAAKNRRLIVVHIGSEDGFIENALLTFESTNTKDYNSQINSIFENWFKDVLGKLEENSVVVMNDSLMRHSRKIEQIPDVSWKTKDIKRWLRSKKMKFDSDMLKTELLHIVGSIKKDYQISAVEKLAKQKNIQILKPPPYHSELNPLEVIWAEVKAEVAKNNKTFKMEDVKTLFLTAIKKVTQETWSNALEHIFEAEKKMWELDVLIEDLVDTLVATDDEESDGSEDE